MKGWVTECGLADSAPIYQYIVSVHWAIAQLQGGTEIVPGSTLGERAFAILAVFVSVIILAKFVSGLTNLSMQLRTLSQNMSILRQVRSYLDKHGVQMELAARV